MFNEMWGKRRRDRTLAGTLRGEASCHRLQVVLRQAEPRTEARQHLPPVSHHCPISDVGLILLTHLNPRFARQAASWCNLKALLRADLEAVESVREWIVSRKAVSIETLPHLQFDV